MSKNIYKWDDVEFHKTFQPQDTYIVKIMELAQSGFTGTKEEISSLTGIPTGKTSGKVVPHIRYAAYMRFVSYLKEGSVYTLSLTELGKVVLREDKYLFENITKMLAHYFISSQFDGALIWSFVYDYLPYRLDEIISNELINNKFSEVFQHDGKDNLNVVKKSYMEGFWQSLRLMDWDDGLCLNSQFYNSDFLYVYAYTLLKDWEQQKGNERELTITQISDELCWNRRFCLDDTETMNVLDELAAEGYISLNKQLHPCTIVRLEQSENITDKLYDSLT